MAEAEAMEIELESAKQKAQFRTESMKKLAEEAQKITPRQIQRDSADLNGSWRIIRSDSQRLALLSSSRSAIEKEMEGLETSFADSSVEFSDLTAKYRSDRRHLSIAERNKASSVKRLKKQIETKEKQLKSIEEQCYEVSSSSFFGHPLCDSLYEKKSVVADELNSLRKRMADEDALLDKRIVELEDNQRTVRAQLIATREKLISLEELMKSTRDALYSCRTAVAMIEHVFLHRLHNLKPYGYVEVGDFTDVIILESICSRSGCLGVVVVKFRVVNDQLLELLATAFCREKFTPKLNRLYELSVDDKGMYHVFEVGIEEAAKYDFKPSNAGSVKGFDHEEKKPKISHDDEIGILNSSKDKSKLFGEEKITQVKQEADCSFPSKVPIETKEEGTKRRAYPLEKQQQPLASSSKRSRDDSDHSEEKSFTGVCRLISNLTKSYKH